VHVGVPPPGGAAIYRTVSSELLPMDLTIFRSHPNAASAQMFSSFLNK
jgi:hypothetical protein